MTEKEHVLALEGTNKNIVVDDPAFIVKNLVRMLESFETEMVDTAENGKEAVEKVEEYGDELDFMTLDITMPEMNGIEALQEILDIQPDLNVIMVSAMGQEDTVKECVMHGAKHFIVKPFEREDGFEKLESVQEG